MATQDQQYQPKQKLNEKEIAILEFIKKNENNPKKLTINQVALDLDEKGLCSRLTTNKIISNLINLKIIKDEKVGNKFHKLKINDEYYYDFNKLEVLLLKSQIQKALEPFEGLLKSKKMEVQVINKAKGEIDVIIGTEPTVEKPKIDTTFMPKALYQYPTDDVLTPRQLQKIAMDQQKKVLKEQDKRLMDHARKLIQDKTKRRKAQKKK
jgi:hypothetical protein